MDKLIPALLVAAVSGLTILTYKHPHAYKKIKLPLVGLFLLLTGMEGAWNVCAMVTFSGLMDYIKPGWIAAANDAMREIQIPSWIVGVTFVGGFYCHFLDYLPRLIEEKPEPKKRSKK